MKKQVVNLAIATLIIVLCIGCMSTKFTSTFKPSKVPHNFKSSEKIHFNITEVVLKGPTHPTKMHTSTLHDITPYTLMDIAKDDYPVLFKETDNALPIRINIVNNYSDNTNSVIFLMMLTGFGIPIQCHYNDNLLISVTLKNIASIKKINTVHKKIKCTRTVWGTVYSTWGLSDIPGKSDIPKESKVTTGLLVKKPPQAAIDIVKQGIINIVVEAISKTNKQELLMAYNKHNPQEKTVVNEVVVEKTHLDQIKTKRKEVKPQYNDDLPDFLK